MNTLPAPAREPAPNPARNLLASPTSHASAVLVLLTALAILCGCTTTPLDRSAKVLTSTVATVDSAMQGYATAVALGAVPVDKQNDVRQLYAQYQTAESIAETAIVAAIKTGDASALEKTSAALIAARDPLLVFLARFNRPPP